VAEVASQGKVDVMRTFLTVIVSFALLGACGEGGAAPPWRVAVNVNDDDVVGLAHIVVAEPGRDALDEVSGDWVATEPAWSPDGRRLAVTVADGDYESSGPDSTEIWVMNGDGDHREQLTRGGFDDHPAWSPDGSRIVFSRSDRVTGKASLLVMDAEGGPPSVLLEEDKGVSIGSPAWSPDGKTIAFARTVTDGPPTYESHSSVWLVGDDGSSPHKLSELSALQLDWHPDGERLLVTVAKPENGELRTVRAGDGSDELVTANAANGRWTPDGTEVVFMSRDTTRRDATWRLVSAEYTEAEGLGPLRPVGDVEDYLVYGYFGLDVS
jgi:dipeptidyl aminopeptidase/acylaminoacyl peptidase